MKRIAWLAVLAALALMLVACSTPAQPETPDATDPSTESTTSLPEDENTAPTDSAEPTVDSTSTTEGDTPTKSEATVSNTENQKTTKPTTAPSDNVVNWEDLFGGDDTTTATKKDETTKATTTTTTTTQPTTTATTQKPQVVDKVTLPAVGTDVDGRGRIFLSAAELKNGVVTLTLHNATDEQGQKWQTEETNYVTYACYDAAGNVLAGKGDYFGTFYIGALQAGEDVTTTFPLPEGAVKVELTGAKIVYWTPWQ